MEKLPFISSYITKNAIKLYLIVLIMVSVIFFIRMLPLHWLLFGIFEVSTFFIFLHLLSRSWNSISEGYFIFRVFTFGLIIRLLYVFFSYFFYIYMTGKAFEFAAADSTFYADFGSWITLAGLEYAFILGEQSQIGTSDMGHPIWIALIQTLFGDSLMIPRLIQSIFSAWMIVLVYKIAKRNFGDAPARYTAIIVMLMPNFIYYCGLHLKETMMIFLVVIFMERADYAIRSDKFKITSIIVPVLAGSLLFLYRTVLGFSVWFAFFTAVIYSSGKLMGWGKRILVGIWCITAIVLIFSGNIEKELKIYWDQRQQNQLTSMQHRASRSQGNSLAQKGSAIIFAPVIVIAPFPTMVNVETQQNQMYIHGAYIVKNVLSFFVFVAFWLILFKYKTGRQHLLLFGFTGTYLIIIAMSAFALSERFHLPALPFLMIFAGFGIYQMDRSLKKLYIPYLIIIGAIIIAWNLFKLAGRGEF